MVRKEEARRSGEGEVLWWSLATGRIRHVSGDVGGWMDQSLGGETSPA
jgi:hypothetical protein